ncbi:hypothetical protein B566_EDAN018154 [Ephemera danica]|nr:hypothetical protein B566_EDAN018154 [Ephemera danica]
MKFVFCCFLPLISGYSNCISVGGYNNGHCFIAGRAVDPRGRHCPCSVCGKSFTCSKDLKRHFDNIHGRFSLPSFAVDTDKTGGRSYCSDCNRSYASKNALIKHYKRSHGIESNPLICHVCHKILKHWDSLKNHLLNVHGIVTKHVKAMVMLWSQQNKLPLCLITGFAVDYIVAGDPTQCSECGKFYSSHYEMTKHFKNIHGIFSQPATCDICNKTYKNKDSLRNHKFKKHGKRASK